MSPIYIPDEFYYYEEIRNYPPRDDIQIIYFHPFRESDIGHLICVHYSHVDNKVTVYDSSYFDEIYLHDQVRDALQRLYPYVGIESIEFVKPGTLQPDDVSCGLFSIAYATALLFRINLKDLRLRLASTGDPNFFMRKHLEQILKQRRITPFPTVLLYVSDEIDV